MDEHTKDCVTDKTACACMATAPTGQVKKKEVRTEN